MIHQKLQLRSPILEVLQLVEESQQFDDMGLQKEIRDAKLGARAILPAKFDLPYNMRTGAKNWQAVLAFGCWA